ncbi:uncharacterized protein LOC113403639 [Vanessa tameamea]|uniref:Uncharacterized protein LOC113403639 n=1 Tax=Vanessa tameamea TaxID=334116 RepID=A0A8B8IS91_VANTA|nr:uncharacterized protein LOC124535951 [Vanessa cardui]XP_047534260.1 uncharacterized protein LOC125068924 [Vanessa atalanta]
MGLPQLENCCFVLDLKTGNIVMGSLNALLSFTMFVIMIVVASTLEPIKYAAEEERDLNAEAAATGLYVMSIILVLMFFAKFCFDIFFVYGVVMERANIIRAYFIMWVVFLLLSIFTFFLNASGYGAGTICMEVFYIGLNIYAILLSHSFYKLLNTREEV